MQAFRMTRSDADFKTFAQQSLYDPASKKSSAAKNGDSLFIGCLLHASDLIGRHLPGSSAGGENLFVPPISLTLSLRHKQLWNF